MYIYIFVYLGTQPCNELKLHFLYRLDLHGLFGVYIYVYIYMYVYSIVPVLVYSLVPQAKGRIHGHHDVFTAGWP